MNHDPHSPKRKRGRPSLRTRKLEDEICRRLMEGESLVAICASDGMPVYSTVALWLLSDGDTGTGADSFSERYRRARAIQADYYAEKSLEIARRREKVRVPGKNGGYYEAVDAAAVQANRLEVDNLHWHAGKLSPKKYGDRQQVEHSGEIEVSLAARVAAMRAKREAQES